MATTSHALVVAGPSGVGKGTLLRRLRSAFPGIFGYSVSYTSRKQRPGEQDGVDYYFVDATTFQKKINQGFFVEYACNFGNFYGTALSEVQRVQSSGKICLLEVDLQGVRQIQESPLGKMAYFIFLRPPSFEVLRKRLEQRGTESEEQRLARLRLAERELNEYRTLHFHSVIINDDLESAYGCLRKQLAEWYPELQQPTTSTSS